MLKPVTAITAALVVPVAMLSGCSTNESSNNNKTTTTSSPSPTAAPGQITTQLKTTDGRAVANATFDFANGYATVTVETVAGHILSPGFHGLHVHAVGRCDGDFSSAGEHYQAPNHTGNPASGDLSPLQARSDGSGKLVTTTNGFTEQDLRSGTSLILHQGGDTVAASDSGTRFACGVISPSASTGTATTTITSVVPVPGTTAGTTETSPATTTTTPPAETTTTTSPTGETTTTTTTTSSPAPPG
ncbi:MAG TPA: superoxide dismutase family protein [Mycobacterium sp.]|jgi:Cu-Zn family superoxide dismutase